MTPFVIKKRQMSCLRNGCKKLTSGKERVEALSNDRKGALLKGGQRRLGKVGLDGPAIVTGYSERGESRNGLKKVDAGDKA